MEGALNVDHSLLRTRKEREEGERKEIEREKRGIKEERGGKKDMGEKIVDCRARCHKGL